MFLIWRYVTFFILIAFVITCSFYLFFDSADLDADMVRRNAPLTFLNVFLLSLFCCFVEWLMRKFTVDRPLRRIREATNRMAQGELSTRIDTADLPAYSKEFIEIAEDFNLMAQELSSTETLRTDFVSNVSHELKTPLAVMRNYAALLKQPNLTEAERREYAAGIDGAVERMSVLITNILPLNKLENQQIAVQPEVYDLSEQVTQCLLGFEELWERKALEIDPDIDEGVEVRADPELLTLVWNNLISNAIKFTESGGTVGVSVKTEGEWAVVAVRDTGCGIGAETLKHIFDKFYQGDTSHATEGNGLGLALVKRVVYLAGGELNVTSAVGEGSRFEVRIRRDGHGQ
ncbi:MAG: HAMP domain-containing histidine kinase [Clostridia bacterium]|nr:HAMP domain-containing histidine kinase [Clostridia bacterium]